MFILHDGSNVLCSNGQVPHLVCQPDPLRPVVHFPLLDVAYLLLESLWYVLVFDDDLSQLLLLLLLVLLFILVIIF